MSELQGVMKQIAASQHRCNFHYHKLFKVNSGSFNPELSIEPFLFYLVLFVFDLLNPSSLY